MEHPRIKGNSDLSENMQKFNIKPKGQIWGAKDPALLAQLDQKKL